MSDSSSGHRMTVSIATSGLWSRGFALKLIPPEECTQDPHDTERNTALDDVPLPDHHFTGRERQPRYRSRGGTACATSRAFELLPRVSPTIWSGTAWRLQAWFDGARSCRSATKQLERSMTSMVGTIRAIMRFPIKPEAAYPQRRGKQAREGDRSAQVSRKHSVDDD